MTITLEELLKNRVSIEKRPKVVEYKKRVGDFEIDTVIGKPYWSISYNS